MIKKVLLLIIIATVPFGGKAQRNAGDTVVNSFIPYFAYSYQFPGGDVAQRYGQNSTVGGGLFYKTNKNWLWGADINFIFGNDIKNAESILRMVQNRDGFIIDGNGTYALYALYERGYSANVRVGKVFPFLSITPNSGLMIMGGAGFLLHRMKIDNQHHTAPQISYDYAKGYDRLTGGISFNEFIGYFFMGRSRVLNFYGGLELYQAFTRSQRDYIFDLMKKDNNKYTDYFVGLKIGWMIPVYRRAPDAYYYY